MASTFFALFDDIASVLDDVALMSKAAAKKTSGVLGDDLALNANQVAGVRADRELPVVWAVAKGSFKNKLILVPSALVLSATIPAAITPLLMAGGAYLCYEGAEKILHSKQEDDQRRDELKTKLQEEGSDIAALEEKKIKGAIKTDFILSAEIIVIALGSVQAAAIEIQIAVVSIVALAMTAGVYGAVAAIVKLDDFGLYLLKTSNGSFSVKKTVGSFLVSSAPRLMKGLSIIGTAAMFLVGGEILSHGAPFLEELVHAASKPFEGGFAATIMETLVRAAIGAIAGIAAVFAVKGALKLKQATVKG